MTRFALALVLLLVPVARADDALPPVEVHAHVEPATITVGTRFKYVVELVTRGNPETRIAQPAERIGDFDIVDFGIEPTVQRDDRTVLRRWYTLVGWTPGEHKIPSPPVHYQMPGAEMQEVPAVETPVTVESLLAKSPDAADIRDIRAPERIPIEWRPYAAIAAGVLALALFGFLVVRLVRSPSRVRPGPPPRPAHEVAIEELERLRARRLVAEGAFKEYYSTLSAIVRSYLEQRFSVRAPEMTTEEFLLASARDGALQAAHRRLLGTFLAESDLVKFARHLPTIGDTERAWEAARRFVDDTAPRPATETMRAAG